MAAARQRFSEDDSFIEVIWKIENFSCSWHVPGRFFSTGALGLQISNCYIIKSFPFIVNASNWTLRLYPRGRDSSEKSSLGVMLHGFKATKYGKLQSIVSFDLLIEISLLDIKNQPRLLTFNKSELKTESLFYKLGSTEELFKNKDLYLPNDILTVRFRIFHESVFRSQDIFVYTKLLYQKNYYTKISVIWPIENFESDVTNPCKITLPVAEKLFTQPANLTLSLKKVKQSEWIEFNLENIVFGSGSMHIQCRITLIESNDLYAFAETTIYHSSSYKWTVKPLLSYEEVLKAAKSSPNSHLEAKCEFLIVNKDPDIWKVCGEPSTRIKSCDRKLEPELESTAVMATKDFLKPDLKNMYKEGLFSDLSLQVESDKYSVHSAILAARSPVIRSMLESDMQEKSTRTILIKDLDSETCSRMLDYFYTDDPGELDVPVACKLYYAEDKYQVSGLKISCTSYLKCNLDKDNVFDVLVLADRHQDEDLKNLAVDYICKNKNSLSVEKWHSFMQEHSLLAATITLKVFQSK